MIRLFFRVLVAIFLVASFSHAAEKAKIVAKDDQYVSYENGIVYDEKTNLEWIVGSDKDTIWDEAKAWVESLSVEGGGWRMPTRNELASLYQKGFGKRNMDPAFKTTGWHVWAGPRSSRTAWGFNFTFGIDGWSYLDDSSTRRGFAVRSRI